METQKLDILKKSSKFEFWLVTKTCTYMMTLGMHRRPFEGRHLVLVRPTNLINSSLSLRQRQPWSGARSETLVSPPPAHLPERGLLAARPVLPRQPPHRPRGCRAPPCWGDGPPAPVPRLPAAQRAAELRQAPAGGRAPVLQHGARACFPQGDARLIIIIFINNLIIIFIKNLIIIFINNLIIIFIKNVIIIFINNLIIIFINNLIIIFIKNLIIIFINNLIIIFINNLIIIFINNLIIIFINNLIIIFINNLIIIFINNLIIIY